MLVSVGATETGQAVKTKEHGTRWDTAYGAECTRVLRCEYYCATSPKCQE